MKTYLIKSAILVSALTIVACANTDEEVSPDGIDDVALPDGKADASLFGACGEEKLLSLLNDPLIGVDGLKERGVHTRAAKNIVAQRNGDDALAGTPDDFIFENIVQVDKVPWVGKSAMNAMARIVEPLCVAPVNSLTEVIFSPQPRDESHLARVEELIDGAQTSVDIAIYSFSDAGIKGALDRAVDRGISVRMVFEPARSEKNDPDGSKSDSYEKIGVDVRYINKIMHHKFAIIDGPREVLSQASTDQGILLTGSGNWSNSAGTVYDENTVVAFGNAELNMRFQKEFNHMWTHSRDFNNGQDHEFFESDPIDESMIIDDSSVDVAMTSDNFRTFVSSSNGETFSIIRGLNTVSDVIVEEINSATKSIWVASGHLRSRPITEALIAKHEADPDLDIKIYLDGQEYVSFFGHNKELATRNTCLDAAGDSESKQSACLDKSYHYSFDINEAGIPQRFKYYAYRWHYSYAPQMHHKYMIIDGDRVISGSYNYSDNAEHNTLENIVIYDESGFPTVVQEFKANFVNVWDTGDGLYDGLLNDIKTSDRVPLVFDAMAITMEQVRELKSAISSNCPEANSTVFRSNPQSHQTCFK